MSFSVEIKGLRELQANIAKLPAQLKSEANGMVQRSAELFVRNAQRDAPVDFGFLKQGISYYPNPVTNLSATMVSSVFYSPYMEWGTITRVSVPGELQSYAIQFKGRGIRRTGGIIPRPFFFKQLAPAKVELEKNVPLLLKDVKL